MSKKKIILITGSALILIVAALGVGYGFARAATPWVVSQMMGGTGGMMGGNRSTGTTSGYSGMMGNGSYTDMMGGNGGMMGSNDGQGTSWMEAMHDWMTSPDGMHTQVWKDLANALGISTDELNTQLSSGKTPAQIAEARNVSLNKLAATLEASVKTSLQEAVTDGVLTQDQADAMLNHMNGNYLQMLEWMGPGSNGCHGNQTNGSNL